MAACCAACSAACASSACAAACAATAAATTASICSAAAMTSILASQSALRSSYSYSQSHYGNSSRSRDSATSDDVDDSGFASPQEFADAVKDTNSKRHTRAISIIAHADEPTKKSFFERLKEDLHLS